MIFKGDYFKDDEIVRAWDGKDGFRIDQKDGKELSYPKTTPAEREAFVNELGRRMAYREKH